MNIDNIGRPIGVSDTHNGITITVDAIIGDNNNVFIVYSVSSVPEEAEGLLFDVVQV